MYKNTDLCNTCLLKVLGECISVYMHIIHLCITMYTCGMYLNISKMLFLSLGKILLFFSFLEIQRKRSCLVALKNDL